MRTFTLNGNWNRKYKILLTKNCSDHVIQVRPTSESKVDDLRRFRWFKEDQTGNHGDFMQLCIP